MRNEGALAGRPGPGAAMTAAQNENAAVRHSSIGLQSLASIRCRDGQILLRRSAGKEERRRGGSPQQRWEAWMMHGEEPSY